MTVLIHRKTANLVFTVLPVPPVLTGTLVFLEHTHPILETLRLQIARPVMLGHTVLVCNIIVICIINFIDYVLLFLLFALLEGKNTIKTYQCYYSDLFQFHPIVTDNNLLVCSAYRVYQLVVVVLPDRFREIGARRNFAETQQPATPPKSRPEIKYGKSSAKEGHRRLRGGVIEEEVSPQVLQEKFSFSNLLA